MRATTSDSGRFKHIFCRRRRRCRHCRWLHRARFVTRTVFDDGHNIVGIPEAGRQQRNGRDKNRAPTSDHRL